MYSCTCIGIGKAHKKITQSRHKCCYLDFKTHIFSWKTSQYPILRYHIIFRTEKIDQILKKKKSYMNHFGMRTVTKC